MSGLLMIPKKKMALIRSMKDKRLSIIYAPTYVPHFPSLDVSTSLKEKHKKITTPERHPLIRNIFRLIPLYQNIPTILLLFSKRITKPAKIINREKMLQKIAMKIPRQYLKISRRARFASDYFN